MKEDIFIVMPPNHPFCTKDNYVMEHRLTMEKEIGRYLKKEEIVHHKNGVKDDNRIENLEIVSKSNHTKIHFKNKKQSKDLIEKRKKSLSISYKKIYKENPYFRQRNEYGMFI